MIKGKRILPTIVESEEFETSLAVSTAYLDTSSLMIRHTLANKKDSIRVKHKYLEKTVYRDSISVREVTIEVTKEKIVYPKSYW